MIKFADKSMQPKLKAIWQESFEDDELYLDFFYKNRFTEDNTLVWTEGENPVAMMTFLPAEMIIDGNPYRTKYVYGVATKPEYRGKGISTALVNYANKLAESNNELLVLVPSSERLFDFYKKCGYSTCFFIKELKINQKEFNQFPKLSYLAANISAEEYKALRDNSFMQDGYVCWDINAIEYVLRENDFCGGTTVKITHDSETYILLYCQKDDILFVNETNLSKEIIFSVLSDIAVREECKSVYVRLNESYDLMLDSRPFGMIYPKICINTSLAYLNLTLD